MRKNMRTLLVFFVFLSACSTLKPNQGSVFPAIDLVSIDGKSLVNNGQLKKPTVLLLFDYDCRHCVEALGDIESDLLDPLSAFELQFIAVGRGHNFQYLASLKEKGNLKIDLIEDQKREIFTSFADKSVPRVYLYDRNGNLQYQHVGWSKLILEKITHEIEIIRNP
jgi:thioredoxin-related protein